MPFLFFFLFFFNLNSTYFIFKLSFLIFEYFQFFLGYFMKYSVFQEFIIHYKFRDISLKDFLSEFIFPIAVQNYLQIVNF